MPVLKFTVPPLTTKPIPVEVTGALRFTVPELTVALPVPASVRLAPLNVTPPVKTMSLAVPCVVRVKLSFAVLTLNPAVESTLILPFTVDRAMFCPLPAAFSA